MNCSSSGRRMIHPDSAISETSIIIDGTAASGKEYTAIPSRAADLTTLVSYALVPGGRRDLLCPVGAIVVPACFSESRSLHGAAPFWTHWIGPFAFNEFLATKSEAIFRFGLARARDTASICVAQGEERVNRRRRSSAQFSDNYMRIVHVKKRLWRSPAPTTASGSSPMSSRALLISWEKSARGLNQVGARSFGQRISELFVSYYIGLAISKQRRSPYSSTNPSSRPIAKDQIPRIDLAPSPDPRPSESTTDPLDLRTGAACAH